MLQMYCKYSIQVRPRKLLCFIENLHADFLATVELLLFNSEIQRDNLAFENTINKILKGYVYTYSHY